LFAGCAPLERLENVTDCGAHPKFPKPAREEVKFEFGPPTMTIGEMVADALLQLFAAVNEMVYVPAVL
jgi:hypothetical protein